MNNKNWLKYGIIFTVVYAFFAIIIAYVLAGSWAIVLLPQLSLFIPFVFISGGLFGHFLYVNKIIATIILVVISIFIILQIVFNSYSSQLSMYKSDKYRAMNPGTAICEGYCPEYVQSNFLDFLSHIDFLQIRF